MEKEFNLSKENSYKSWGWIKNKNKEMENESLER